MHKIHILDLISLIKQLIILLAEISRPEKSHTVDGLQVARRLK